MDIQPENKYAAMTVNERLYVSGLMDKFDRAVIEKNVNEVVLILKKEELSESLIKPLLIRLGLYNNRMLKNRVSAKKFKCAFVLYDH